MLLWENQEHYVYLTVLKEPFILSLLGLAIRCYQCSSDKDPKGHDNCGAYRAFNKTEHVPIECNSDESNMPGSFCMKVIQQGPRGFICKFPLNLLALLIA